MVGYFTKIVFLFIFAFTAIYQFFGLEKSGSQIHTFDYKGALSEYRTGMFFYFFIVAIFLVSFFILKHGREKVKYYLWEIILYFLINLLVISLISFGINSDSSLGGVYLFFKIIGFLILPFIIFFSCYNFGEYILSKIPNFKNETGVFKYLTSQTFGFFVFIFLFTIIGFLGFYNLIVFFTLIILFLGVSYKNIISNLKKLANLRFEYEDKGNEFYLITKELGFFIITFIISINFISIVRAFPIGWDDLGVYMNFPKILAQNHELSNLGGMMSWQIFTGIGYLFNVPAQAFFLNNVGGIMSVIALVLIFGELFKSSKKTFLDIPMILAGIFISMPMVVFQQAKDMKLDIGLFYVSIVAVYIIYYVFIKYVGYSREIKNNNFELKEEITPDGMTLEVTSKNVNSNFLSYFKKFKSIGNRDIFQDKSYLLYILLAGIITGFAFSIKLTALLLISALIGVIFYSMLGFSGLLSYVFFYTGIFTKLNLWSIMNVSYIDTNINLITFISFIFGIILLGYSIHKYTFNIFKKFLVVLGLFLSGIVISLSFYLVYNISTIDTFSPTKIISGQDVKFRPDYTKIYSQEDLEKLDLEYDKKLFTESGTSTNEDLGRYFGYEKGINNYIKLPYNLSMQVNQDGEFTNITFLYFALIPLVLFLAFKSQVFSIISFVITSLGFLYMIPSNSSLSLNITNFLANFNLPVGYLLICLFFFIPLVFFLFGLNKEKFSMLFRLNIVFSFIYTFLWSISSFGIVWYGITMYFSFLLIIGTGLYYVSNYDKKTKEQKLAGTIFVYLIIIIYYIGYLFPYGYSNIIQAYPSEYKNGQNLYISIFTQKYDYFKTISEFNLKSKTDYYDYIYSSIENSNLKELIDTNNIDNLDDLILVLLQLSYSSGVPEELALDSKKILIEIFKEVYSPREEFKNDKMIYRVGTFYKYFIDNNIKRFYGDSMLTNFDKYFYDENNIDTAVDRLKTLGIDYMLVDLNAATIDKDERHDLTRRFENILKTFASDKIELVDTDSICLKYALTKYNKTEKSAGDLKDFLDTAGVNYESYDENGNQIGRGTKMESCYKEIASIIVYGKYNSKDYPYLNEINQSVTNNNLFINPGVDDEETMTKKFDSIVNIIYNSNRQSYFASFKIK